MCILGKDALFLNKQCVHNKGNVAKIRVLHPCGHSKQCLHCCCSCVIISGHMCSYLGGY